ncbi:GNAT family N-acetyltransferase [Cytobacillus dafuensis]|uniref:GNAT family N-acetyltransferase n=1 Tax=Cytobacillus dafuensis TaxID=1742359 RepID=A0A5B8Z7G8_CYTDA|nr:GNAT family N-acetyltransferase [Cytobacillus dafuensis]QED47316.1 GNAT family N-acetyltransferase [Cytobacillus dafuensis]
MEIIYETKRLCLCVFDDIHLDSVKEFWGDEEVMTLCNGSSPHNVLLQVMNGYRKCHYANALSVYAVLDKEANEIIGAAGFNITGPLDNVELIYHFSKKSWGKGFATEAANACLVLAKNHGKVRLITASADPQNKGSLKILEKIGFTYKGTKWFEDTEQEEPYYEYKV